MQAVQVVLGNLRYTVLAGLVLTFVLFLIAGAILGGLSFDQGWWQFLFRWLHVVSGIMWVGLLWYFNFVQIPSMPKIPDEQKPAIIRVIAPAAMWWFRWAAMATLATGLILAQLNGYLIDAFALGLTDGGASTPIGIGMWLATIMWFNVWFVIWPRQKIALGLVSASDVGRAAATRTAMLVSRANTALSLPMLYCMVAMQNGGFA